MGRKQRLYSVTVWALWLLLDKIILEFDFKLENAGINFAFTIALTMVSVSSSVTEGQEKLSAMDASDLSCAKIFLLAGIHNHWCCCAVFSLCQLPQIPVPLKVPANLSLGPKLLHMSKTAFKHFASHSDWVSLNVPSSVPRCMSLPLKEKSYLPLHHSNNIKATRRFIYSWVLNTDLEDFILVLISWILLFWIYCQWLKAYTGWEGEREQMSHIT